jgi:Velvet factor
MTALDPVSPSNTHFPPERLLYGNIVSSPHYLRNLQGRPGVYFIFPDVSVRLQGRYVLRLTLMRLSRYASAPLPELGPSVPICLVVLTRYGKS